MSIIWSGLAPHPPIIIPEIGLDRISEAEKTVAGCKALAQDFSNHGCSTLVLLSPHSPRPSRGITVFCDPMLRGNFSAFGHPELTYSFLNALEWIQEFSRHFSSIKLSERNQLDHGALVPLHFIHETGWKGNTVVLGMPWEENEIPAVAGAIAETCQRFPNVGLLASGDMSHCIRPGAPSPFHPSGKKFDDLFVSLLKKNQFSQVEKRTKALRSQACEDVFYSCQVAWLATDFNSNNSRFFSYECPFGVGYTVTRFFATG